MRNLVIFTDVGGDSDDTLMLLMAREAHLRGDCNVVGVVCSGTHNNEASAGYAYWLLNPEWIDIPVIGGHSRLSLPSIFPVPSFQPTPFPQHGMMRKRLSEVTDGLTYLICGPTGDVPDLLEDLGFGRNHSATQDLHPSCYPIKLVLMGMLNEDGSPNFEKAYNLRANKEATERVFKELGSIYKLDLVIDRDECYQYAIKEGFYDKLMDNSLWAHHLRLVKRNLGIVEKHLPDVWKRVYEGNETLAIPYDAVAFWKAVYPDEEPSNFWHRLDDALHVHPRAF